MPIREIHDAVIEGDADRVAALTRDLIDGGTDVSAILDQGMIASLDEVGVRFSEGEMFVPEMLMSARAVQAGLDIVRPILIDTGAKPTGTVVIGTVSGDVHDIGKNLVGMMLEGRGFAVHDLGTDVGPETFLASAIKLDADIIAMSALLSTSMIEMEKTVAAINEAKAGGRVDVETMIGGAPVSEAFAHHIGAAGFGVDAPRAARLACELVAARAGISDAG